MADTVQHVNLESIVVAILQIFHKGILRNKNYSPFPKFNENPQTIHST